MNELDPCLSTLP